MSEDTQFGVHSITYERVRDLLREIVAERPDFVAERFPYSNGVKGCRYADDEGEPSCIIGVLLDRLGIDRAVLKELDDECTLMNGTKTPQALGSSEHDVWNCFTPDAMKFLSDVQTEQDQADATWNMAVERAIGLRAAVTYPPAAPEESA